MNHSVFSSQASATRGRRSRGSEKKEQFQSFETGVQTCPKTGAGNGAGKPRQAALPLLERWAFPRPKILLEQIEVRHG